MKRSSLRLFGLVLAVTVLACHNDTPPAPAKKRIDLLGKVVETYYLPNHKGFVDSSKVTPVSYNGRDFLYISSQETTYQYDSLQRTRLIRTVNIDHPNDFYYNNTQTRLDYLPNQIHRYFSATTGVDIYPLNKFGYISSYGGDIPNVFTYDEAGYQIKFENPFVTVIRTIENGNVVRQTEKQENQTKTTLYEFDPQRAGLPDPNQVFNGTPNRNLLSRMTEVWENQKPVQGVSTTLRIVTTYTYELGADGRVKRQTAYKEIKNSPIGEIGEELSIKEFDYVP